MTLIYSFLFCGFVCFIGQIILNNTKLTPGHITSIFVVIGSILGIFGIYDKISDVVGAGANVPIISFGNTLTNYTYLGYIEKGFLGLFSNMLIGVSTGIVSAVVFSFILTLFSKPKD
jgi:stage V sporulation protein AE